jgi:hypothetical protein
MKYLIKFTITILLLSVLACTERIEIKLDESSVKLVVDGAITTDTLAHKVVLTKTTSYFYDQPAPPVTGAKVTISDGETVFNLEEAKPGEYFTEPDVYGIPGKTYTLKIRLTEKIGGYTDYTSSSIINIVSSLDSIHLNFHPDWSEQGMWEVRSYFRDQPTTDYYRFVVSRNNESISDTINEWFVTDDRFFVGNYTYDLPVAFLDQATSDERLQNGDIVTVEMNSIGKAYAQFISDAQAELMGSYPLFTGPPANVKGNINNGAIGFFAAYSVSRAYTITP